MPHYVYHPTLKLMVSKVTLASKPVPRRGAREIKKAGEGEQLSCDGYFKSQSNISENSSGLNFSDKSNVEAT